MARQGKLQRGSIHTHGHMSREPGRTPFRYGFGTFRRLRLQEHTRTAARKLRPAKAAEPVQRRGNARMSRANHRRERVLDRFARSKG
jgi:hypothetical protein